MARAICAGYAAFDKETQRDRLQAFEAAAAQLGTVPAIAEKDFWVCRVIDFLFNGRGDRLRPTITFKGGTSLSKGYGLIHRFSEDIDVVLSVPGLYDRATPNPFRKTISKTKMPAVMLGVLARAETYVHGRMHDELEHHFQPLGCRLQKFPNDGACVSLGLHYPAIAGMEGYLTGHVLLQCCVRADTEPHSPVPITPYVQRVLRGKWDLTTHDVRTLRPSRTFVEKLFAMHEAAAKFERDRGNVADKNRLSRHYYDVSMMHDTAFASRALSGTMFSKVRKNQEYRWSQRGWILATAKPGTLKIMPPDGLRVPLSRDYDGMQSMMFDRPKPPTFDEILEALARLDHDVNRSLLV